MRRLAVVVALGLVAACGGGSDQSAPSATAVTDTGTPTTTVVASTSVELTTTAAPTTTSATTTTGVATSTTQPVEETESVDPTAQTERSDEAGADGGDGGFSSDPPEVQACARDALGDTIYDAIAWGGRAPTDADNAAMDHCYGGGSGPERSDEAGADGGDGAFSSDPPEVRACARDALGETIYDAIAWGGRSPTDADNAAMNHCYGGDSGPEPTPSSSSAGNQGGPVGGPVDEWTLAQPGLSYACPAANVNHADSGEFTWSQRRVPSGEVANFAISPTSPNVVYMAIEVNVHAAYRSDDFGDTWTQLHLSDHAKDIAVHPTDPAIAFLADSHSLLRTSTGEPESFEEIVTGDVYGPAAASFSSVVVSLSEPNVVYTAQKGEDAQQQSLGMDGGIVYRSTDGGRTFQVVASGTPVVNVLAIDPTNAERLLIGSNDGIHESLDGGRTYQVIPGAAGLSKVIDLQSHDGSTWYAATEDGVARSTDDGQTWQSSTTGLPSPLVQRVEAVRDAPNVVWAATRRGVGRSTDGGGTFQDVSGFGTQGGLPAVNLDALGVWPDDPDMAIVSTNSLIFSVRAADQVEFQGQLFGQGIFKTEDAGLTWRQVAYEAAETAFIEIQTNPLRPTEVWTGQQASRGIFRSRDAGQSWSQSSTILAHYPMKMAFVPGNPDRLVMTSRHQAEAFGVTTDSGVSWSTRSELSFFDAVDMGRDLLNEQLIDGGNIHLHGLAIAPDDPNLILVGSVHEDSSSFGSMALSGSHIYRSTDGGSTWMESMDGYDFQAEAAVHDIVFDPTNPDRVYVGTTDVESVFGNGIWRSMDRGLSWERSNAGMADDTSVNEIVVHPTNGSLIVAATDQGMYASTDHGGSWTQTHASAAWDAEVDVTNPGVVYAGTNTGVLLSKDFGQTWQDITTDQLTSELWPLDDMGSLAFDYNPLYGAKAVGVSCDGAIVYAAISGLGVMVSVAPGYAEIPEDPDQASVMSQRTQANMYDSRFRARR